MVTLIHAGIAISAFWGLAFFVTAVYDNTLLPRAGGRKVPPKITGDAPTGAPRKTTGKTERDDSRRNAGRATNLSAPVRLALTSHGLRIVGGFIRPVMPLTLTKGHAHA